MPDKKLTDNEIIKALEYCTNNDECDTDCPCFSEKESMCGNYNGLLKQILDLINRLQAENERLKTASDNKTEELLRHNTFIEELHEKLKTAKAEAYKEFDKQIKEDCLSCPLEKDDITMLVDVKNYNNLFEELVGEDNG